MIVIEDDANSFHVYPKRYPMFVVYRDKTSKFNYGDVVFLKRRFFVFTEQGLLPEGHEELLGDIIRALSPNEYSVKIYARSTHYKIGEYNIVVKGKRLLIDGTEVTSVEDVLYHSRPLQKCYTDEFLIPCKNTFKWPYYKIYNEDVATKIPIHYSWPILVFGSYFSIETVDGQRKIPARPVFIRTDDEYYIDPVILGKKDGIKAMHQDFIVNDAVTITRYGKFFYESPENWRALLENGEYFRRCGKMWCRRLADEKSEYGETWVTNDAVIVKRPTLPTGQKALYAKFHGNEVRIYGILTPEGMFVLDVPRERLKNPNPISALEKTTRIIGTLFVFPIQINFEKSEVFYDGGRDELHVIIDGKKTIIPLRQEEFTHETGAKVLKALGVTEDKYTLAMNYGVSF